jgi:hypothetical protein
LLILFLHDYLQNCFTWWIEKQKLRGKFMVQYVKTKYDEFKSILEFQTVYKNVIVMSDINIRVL